MYAMGSIEKSHALIDKAQRGEREAFEELIAIHRARLEALVRSRLGTRLKGSVLPEDVLQETFLQALRSMQSFRWEGEDSFLRWLGGIAENAIRKESRRLEQSRHIRLRAARAPPPSPSKQMRRDERFDRLQATLDKLSEDQRQAILLTRIEGLIVKEAAARMGRSETAVRNLLLRALKRLRESFGDTESLHLADRSLAEEEKGKG
jgi:RNA polymerase sigma-70 factor (ECF subfamily)